MSRRTAALVVAAAVLAAGLTLGAAPAALAAEPAQMKTTSVSRDGMTMLPFRQTMEDAGYTVYFNSSDQSFYAELGGTWVWAPLYDNYAVVNGETVRLSRGPVIVQGVAYYPEDFFQGAFSGWYGWGSAWPRYPSTGWSRVIEGLRFRLVYERDDPGRIGLVVKNVTASEKTLKFPTGKTHEIVLKRNGAKVWSSADGKMYTQAVQYVTLKAGESKTYWTDLPGLAGGSYNVEAYFSGIPYTGIVTKKTISIERWNDGPIYGWDPLQYSLSFSQGWSSTLNPPQLVLRVKNPTGREVIFPYNHEYEFVIWGSDGSVTRKELPGMSRSDYVQKISAGASQTHFIYLNGLKRGTYYAEGYIKEGGRIVRTLGGVNFTIK